MLNFDPLYHPYPSRRMTVYGRRGMVATSHPLAAQAGLAVLQAGGNAMDAAVATAAALTVVEPTSNGIGSDAFALIWHQGKLHGLNSSGPSANALNIKKVKSMGYQEMPVYGWLPVTVPGAPAAWAAVSKKFGRLPFSKVLAPAIELAEQGHPVAPIAGKYWNRAYQAYQKKLQGNLFEEWFHTFAPHGRPPQPGEIWRSPGHARTLIEIAETQAESFYRGRIAEQIVQHAAATGGFLSIEDLGSYSPEWVDPISIRYRGYDVWEIPPNGQGIVALMALGMLAEDELAGRENEWVLHLSIEAIKKAFQIAKEEVTDARWMRTTKEDLLSSEKLRACRQQIGTEAKQPGIQPDAGGTVYLATADGEGNMVSFIQSNYMGFGSGVVVPGTGISLQNRGHTFSLNEQHINALAPGKRTYHTIIPGFLSKDGEAMGPFGVMGGFMQPQGHLQVLQNVLDFQLNPQAALDAPRWQWVEGNRVQIERNVPAHVAEALSQRGHELQIMNDGGSFGRGQIIWRRADGVLAGATEPRTDGCVAAW
ncbi:gamma-glutamyltransferase family protein [Alicyclobacillus sp. TC]|uniref:Gamma-glutamyltransferase 2. Threonine peptidase. MEROPS family T03 n=1 Tax=Alicyclobacillus tolerans TaxID=90970 RepID=A0A1M6R8H3_9BACL|nr:MULTISPECIES: gamma-glutamyltransferase family protein [Alicyclobacillus]QRF22398.1 gamma-glutamyltransferase family protein [Alicyclobacillus sp. TC]SHK28628.1 gamma-glutamyltransferase 2. Threonine peptidase. MEROPS family T03 [Alicyclobacillus montanus]